MQKKKNIKKFNKQGNQSSITDFSIVELRNFYFLADRVANQPYADILTTFQELKNHQETLQELDTKLKYVDSKQLDSEEIDVLKKIIKIMTGTKESILEDKVLLSERENSVLYELKYKLKPYIYKSQKKKH